MWSCFFFNGNVQPRVKDERHDLREATAETRRSSTFTVASVCSTDRQSARTRTPSPPYFTKKVVTDNRIDSKVSFLSKPFFQAELPGVYIHAHQHS